MDKIILDCTKENIQQRKNRWFIEGDPAALLIIEFRGNTIDEAKEKAESMIADLQKEKYGYAYPRILSDKTKQVTDLEKSWIRFISKYPWR